MIVARADSRLEIAKKFSTISLTHIWDTVKYGIFALSVRDVWQRRENHTK